MVVIVVFDEVTLLDVAGAGEVFVEANRFGADYQLKIASMDGYDVTSSIGTRLGVTDQPFVDRIRRHRAGCWQRRPPQATD